MFYCKSFVLLPILWDIWRVQQQWHNPLMNGKSCIYRCYFLIWLWHWGVPLASLGHLKWIQKRWLNLLDERFRQSPMGLYMLTTCVGKRQSVQGTGSTWKIEAEMVLIFFNLTCHAVWWPHFVSAYSWHATTKTWVPTDRKKSGHF